MNAWIPQGSTETASEPANVPKATEDPTKATCVEQSADWVNIRDTGTMPLPETRPWACTLRKETLGPVFRVVQSYSEEYQVNIRTIMVKISPSLPCAPVEVKNPRKEAQIPFLDSSHLTPEEIKKTSDTIYTRSKKKKKKIVFPLMKRNPEHVHSQWRSKMRGKREYPVSRVIPSQWENFRKSEHDRWLEVNKIHLLYTETRIRTCTAQWRLQIRGKKTMSNFSSHSVTLCEK